MNLKNYFLILAAALVLAPAAFADNSGYSTYPMATTPPRPAPLPDEPSQPPQHGGEIIKERVTIIVQRRMINMSANLSMLADLNRRYHGYTVESVEVDVRGGAYGTYMDLVINNWVEQSFLNPYGQVLYYLRPNMQVGRDIESMLIGVRGVADVDAIHINLSKCKDGDDDHPPTPH